VTLTIASAGRRYVALTALRWLPMGLSIPVTVLLAQSRGLSLSQIGLVFVAHSVIALLLELPTGGLADAIGRRPVLVLSGLLQMAGLLVLAAAQNVATFALAFAIVGAGRALDSGPLESWYVDAVHQIDPAADVTPGLSRAAVADGLALSAGAVLGGVLPALAGGGSTPLTLPMLAGAVVAAANIVGVLVFVTPLGASRHDSAGSRLRESIREVPVIVGDTVRLATRDAVLRLLVAITFLAGMVLSTLELLGPVRFADLTGSRTDGTAAFGVVMAVSFGAAALGSALATTARRAARGSIAVATAVTSALCAVALAAIAVAPSAVLTGVAFAAFYLWNGSGWPLRKQLMHSRVDSSRRATTVSASSFALMLGGITGSLTLPLLTEWTNLPTGFATAGVLLLVSAGLSLRLPTTSDSDRSAAPVDPADAATGAAEPLGAAPRL